MLEWRRGIESVGRGVGLEVLVGWVWAVGVVVVVGGPAIEA